MQRNLLPGALGALKANVGALLGAEVNAQGVECENEDNFFSSAENANSHVAERIPSVIYFLEQNAQFLFFNGMHSFVLQTEYPLYQQMLLIRKFLRMLVTLHDDMEVCYGKTQQRVLICTCEN
ncbi:hypothetical protein CsSME_00011025 [Camellia sinensis var. sinensis]